MDIGLLADNLEILIALLAGVAVVAAIFVVSWPYFVRDHLTERMVQVTNENERIRVRERNRLNASTKQISLRSEPKRLYKLIVDRLNLAGTEDSETVRMLRMAGYRGEGPIIAYLAIRQLAPLGMMVLAALYVFVILRLDYPLFVNLGIVMAAAALGYYAPPLYVKNKITNRQSSIRGSWPDALDLLLICVESGMGIEGALRKVSTEIGTQSVELAEELALTTAELSYLQDRRKAYENFAARTGLDGVKGVVTSLIQSEKYGTALSQSLRVQAQENRDMRMNEAEKKAAALPPKLTVPMIVFFLPVLFAVIITPAVIQMMRV
ncbi:type II secretion system F family protein [Microvirga brassicacearum]|uniref:Type II secretion system F family protein n=1 Tax=Microvirga brassicacearum TaxID=2580413 RepID=A0A5N3P7Y6_9HYPH|nr:type II secretion system F family protein [Microvirga brassicacearum]KAB0265761.1 type II secretion system F family protein [Microvirga brassicacearum]